MKDLSELIIQHKCVDCDLRDNDFFCEFRKSNLAVFDSLKITNTYPKGSILFMKGQPSNGIYMLCQGKVKLYTSSRDGKVILLHVAEAGEVLGLSCAVSGLDHIATAEVIEPCQINFIRTEEFLRFLGQNAEACLGVIKQLSQNYHTAYLQICSLGLSGSVGEKLAKLFLGWCKARTEQADGIHMRVSYTQEEIAEMIGTSRETVSRLLKEFKERNLISFEKSKLIIHDKEALEMAFLND